MEKILITLQDVELPSQVYDVIAEAAEFNELTIESELVVTLKDAIRKKYKIRRLLGRPPQEKATPTPAILEELAELTRKRFVDRRPDGEFVGVTAHGSSWKARAPNKALNNPNQYLGIYRTKEEAAVIRGRILREQEIADIAEALAVQQLLDKTTAAMPEDPQDPDYQRALTIAEALVEEDRLQVRSGKFGIDNPNSDPDIVDVTEADLLGGATVILPVDPMKNW